MAVQMVLTAAFCSITGPGDISGNLKKCELSMEVEEKDVTNFASLGWKEVKGGLKSGGLALEFQNDMTDDGLDEDFWTIFGTVAAFEVRASSASVGVSNPKYTGNVLIKSWTPVSGAPGDINGFSATFPTSGVVTRATS